MTTSGDGLQKLSAEARKPVWADAFVLSGLALLVLLAFWEVLFGGRVFFFRDFSLLFYSKRFAAAESIRNFEIPFWTSMSGCGEPVLGAYQRAIFYPLAAIYYVFPMPASFMWFVVLHVFLTGAGAYYMMRVWGVRRPAAAFTAFAWAFSPAFISAFDYVSLYTSLAWLPWCLAFARRITNGTARGGFLWLALAFAMAVLAASPEPVLFIVVMVAGYAVWNFVSAGRKCGWSSAWRRPALILAALVMGLLLSGVELAPFLSALRYSAREQGLSLADAGRYSVIPGDAILFFLPRFYLAPGLGGIYWSEQVIFASVYLSALVPFLVLWTLAAVRRKRNLFFAAAALAFGALSLGPHSPVWRLAYDYVPLVSMIRFPVKFFLPAAFSFAVLAGFAVDDLFVSARKKEFARPASLVVAVLVASILFAVSWAVMKAYPEDVFKRITPKELLTGNESDAENAADRFEGTQWSFGNSSVQLALGAAALIFVIALARRRVPRPYGGIALVLVLFVDAGLFGAHVNPVAGPEIYTEKPANLSKVPHGVSDTRVLVTPLLETNLTYLHLERINDLAGLINYLKLVKGVEFSKPDDLFAFLRRTSAPSFATLDELDQWLRTTNTAEFATDLEYERTKETFTPNSNLFYGVPVYNDFEPMAVKWHAELARNVWGKGLPPARLFFMTRFWGVGTVIDAQPGPPGYAFFPLQPPGSRALLADHVVPARDDSDAISVIAKTDIDVLKRIVLIGPDAFEAVDFLGSSAAEEPAEAAAPLGTAKVVSDTGNTCVVEVDASKKALLYMADNYFPNFAATVDGKPATLWRANYAYRAVPVEPGRHTVEFVWQPYDFYIGIAMTLAAVVALIVIAIISRAPKRAPGADNVSTPG